MIKQMPLTEEERESIKNENCECDCGHNPLKHFEQCPKCKSEAYHVSIESRKEVEVGFL